MIYQPKLHHLLEVTLNTGRLIRAESIQVQLTYLSLLEGIPSAAVNESHFKDFLPQRVARLFGKGWPVHVVQSEVLRAEEPHPYPPLRDRGEILRLEAWPEVEFAAFFNSGPARDSTKLLSGLVLVWHQNEFMPVINEVTRNKIATLEWEKLALDYDGY